MKVSVTVGKRDKTTATGGRAGVGAGAGWTVIGMGEAKGERAKLKPRCPKRDSAQADGGESQACSISTAHK